jgi:hypothetical protein
MADAQNHYWRHKTLLIKISIIPKTTIANRQNLIHRETNIVTFVAAKPFGMRLCIVHFNVYFGINPF